MSYFFRQLVHFAKREFDESKVTRGKTTPASNSGSFAPRGAGDGGAAGPDSQRGFTNYGPAVVDALTKVRDFATAWGARALGKKSQPGVRDRSSLEAAAQASKPLFDGFMRGVATSLGGSVIAGSSAIMATAADLLARPTISAPLVMIADIKGGDRVDRKAQIAYNGDYSRIRDMVRGSIVVPRADQLDEALEALERSGMRLAVAPKDRVNTPAPGGYRDVMLNVELDNGHIAEVQVVTPAVFAAKMLKAHDLYADIRELMEELEATGREPTRAEARRIDDNLRQQQELLYGPAWAKDTA